MNNPFETIESRLDKIETLLISIKHNPKPETTMGMDDLPIDINKASRIIGLTVPTIYGLVHRREIPVLKRRGKLMFIRQELIDWLKAGRKKTIEELRQSTMTPNNNII
jgi:hypothetical protein